MADTSQQRGLLRNLPLFAGIPQETVDRLTRDLVEKRFKKGETLTRQGAKDLKAIFLLEGKIGVYAESKEGLKTAVIFHDAPYVIGVMELWREKPYLGTALAIEPCRATVVSKRDFLALLQANHQVAVNMVQMLSNLLYRTSVDRRIRLFGRVEHLVANTLCSFAQMYGEEHGYGVLIRKDVNKSEIAEILGVARRSVIRAVDDLCREGLIQIEGRQLIIPDLEALRRKAHSPME